MPWLAEACFSIEGLGSILMCQSKSFFRAEAFHDELNYLLPTFAYGWRQARPVLLIVTRYDFERFCFLYAGIALDQVFECSNKVFIGQKKFADQPAISKLLRRLEIQWQNCNPRSIHLTFTHFRESHLDKRQSCQWTEIPGGGLAYKQEGRWTTIVCGHGLFRLL